MDDDSVVSDLDLAVEPARPEQLLRMAHAVLEVSYEVLHPTPVSQLAVGWLRAAHDQIAAIADLTMRGRRSATGPNARAVAELAIRIMWLHQLEDRDAAMPALIEHERNLAERHVTHSAGMGLTVDIDPLYGDLDIDQLGSTDPTLGSQIRGVVDAAKAAEHAVGIYQLWRAATQYSHATTRFAGMWAPTHSGRFVPSESSPDWSGSLHLLSVLISTLTSRILIDEGTAVEDASLFLAAAVNNLHADVEDGR